MNEKKHSKKIAYVISISRIFDVSWEWLFIFFCSFSFVSLTNGGLLTALIFINCALTRAIFSRKIATLTERSENRSRLLASMGFRLLSIIAFMLLPNIASHFYSLFLWSTVVNIIFIFDEYLTFGLKYIFNDKKYISLTRFNSIFNLGKRGSIVISSSIAYLLGENNWQGLSYIFIFVSVVGLLISIITFVYFGNDSYDEIEDKIKRDEIHETFVSNGIEYNEKVLFPLYLFLINLFFSSTALLLSRALVEYKLILFDSFNIISSFYSGFVLFNCLVLWLDKFFEKLYKIRHLIDCYLLTILISYSLYLFQNQLLLCLISACIFGVIYGFTLSCFYSLSTTLIRGKEQNKLYATIDVSGRVGMIISQLATGFFLDCHYDPLTLMRNNALIAFSAPLLFAIWHSKKIIIRLKR